MSADNPNNVDKTPPPPTGPAPFDPANPAPGQAIDAAGGRFYYLGEDPATGKPMWSSFVSAKSGTVVINGRLVDPETGQVIADFSQAAGGGGVSPTSIYSNQQQNARDAAALAEQQRQYNETLGYNKARGDQQQRVSDAGVSGMFNGAPTENARQFNTRTALDYYQQLAHDAANPRNFVQSLFQQRGQFAPAGSEQFGNLAALRQFLPNFVGQGSAGDAMARGASNNVSGTSGVGVPLTQTSAGANATTTAPSTPGVQQQYNAQQVAAMTPRQVPTSTPGTLWSPGGANGTFTPGTGYGAGGQSFTGNPTAANNPNPGQPFFTDAASSDAWVAAHPPSAGELAQRERNSDVGYRQSRGLDTTGYAKGGVIPEPVVGVGVHSGQKYMFGENGPEGVVPAHMLPKFLQQRHGQQTQMGHGYAYGGEIGYMSPDDPYSAPYSSPTTGGTLKGPGGGFAYPDLGYDPTTSNMVQPATGAITDTSGLPTGGYQSPLPGTTPAPIGMQGTGTGVATLGGFSAPTNTVTPPVNTVTPPQNTVTPPDRELPTTSTTKQYTPEEVAAMTKGVLAPVTPTKTVITPPGRTPLELPSSGGGTPSPVQQPGGTPQASNNFNASAPAAPAQVVPGTNTPMPTLTPRDVAPAGTFGSPSGNRPSFLPGEDQGNSTLQSLLQANALPPFLSRLFAQDHGIQSQGTNTPQRQDLPKDVPLVSSLAYSQMNPSEQQALLSYVSSYGVTPEDYIALIQQYAPQGPRSQTPTFGSRFAFNRPA